MALSLYPYSDEYVVPGGAGANDGSSWANAWDISQVGAAIGPTKRFNFSGDFPTTGAALAWSTGGSTNGPIVFRGWNAAQDALASFGDMPIIRGPAGTTTITPGNYQIYQGLNIKDGQSGISSAAVDNIAVDLCQFDNIGIGTALGFDNYGVVSRSKFFNNDGVCVDGDIGTHIRCSQFYDNNGTKQISGLAGLSVEFCFIARGAQHGIELPGVQLSTIRFNTIDGHAAGNGIDMTTVSGPILMYGNQFSNNLIATDVSASNLKMFNNFHNNGTDDGGNTHIDVSNTFVDPQYTDIANNDYSIGNTDLQGIDMSTFGAGVMDVGAYQSAGGGGGGGGAGYHTRIGF